MYEPPAFLKEGLEVDDDLAIGLELAVALGLVHALFRTAQANLKEGAEEGLCLVHVTAPRKADGMAEADAKRPA